MGSTTGMSTSAQRKAPEPDIAAAAAAAATSAREKERARRRRRAGMRGYGDEYMDMNVQVEPDWGDPSGVGVPPAGGASRSRRPWRRIGAPKIWDSPARHARRPSLRRLGWPRWPATSLAAGRQSLWCRAPGRPNSGRLVRGSTPLIITLKMIIIFSRLHCLAGSAENRPPSIRNMLISATGTGAES